MSADTCDTQHNVCTRKFYWILDLLYAFFRWSRIDWFRKFSFIHVSTAISWPRVLHFLGFGIILGCITLSKTPLDEWSARRKVRYLTTHSTHKRQTSTLPVRFEPAIRAKEQQWTHALDRALDHISKVQLPN
jgi:hypothetical protein